jgi:hypothetical protein
MSRLRNLVLGRKETKKYFIINSYVQASEKQNKFYKKFTKFSINLKKFEKWKRFPKKKMSYVEFYGMSWRYFKFKIEKFFYKQLGMRLHIWFLNVWDIFIAGIESYWQWFRYEDSTTFFLTRKGQRVMLERREEAKFYIRTMALTLTFSGELNYLWTKYRIWWNIIEIIEPLYCTLADL